MAMNKFQSYIAIDKIERPEFLKQIEEKVVNPNPPKTIEVAGNDAVLMVNGKRITRDTDPTNYALIMGIRKNPEITKHWPEINDENKMPPDFEIKDGILTMRDEAGKVLTQVKDFAPAPVKESVQSINETANDDVIEAFMSGNIPSNRRFPWGTAHLKINKENDSDFSLVNYSTPIAFRHEESVWFNGQKYSVTTSKIQSQIRGSASRNHVDMIETDGDGIRDAISDAHDARRLQDRPEPEETEPPVNPSESKVEPKIPAIVESTKHTAEELRKGPVGRILL